MSLIHDIVKIKYVDEGLLPYWPYHLISDEEMFEAFILSDECAFDIYYPEPSDCCEEVIEAHRSLRSFLKTMISEYVINEYYGGVYGDSDGCICTCIDRSKVKRNSFGFEIDKVPDWVYTYMLGEVIGPESKEHDRHDLFVAMNIDNVYDEFTDDIYMSILKMSKNQIAKVRESFTGTIDSERVPTIYGEPGIIYQLRVEDVSI